MYDSDLPQVQEAGLLYASSRTSRPTTYSLTSLGVVLVNIQTSFSHGRCEKELCVIRSDQLLLCTYMYHRSLTHMRVSYPLEAEAPGQVNGILCHASSCQVSIALIRKGVTLRPYSVSDFTGSVNEAYIHSSTLRFTPCIFPFFPSIYTQPSACKASPKITVVRSASEDPVSLNDRISRIEESWSTFLEFHSVYHQP